MTYALFMAPPSPLSCGAEDPVVRSSAQSAFLETAIPLEHVLYKSCWVGSTSR